MSRDATAAGERQGVTHMAQEIAEQPAALAATFEALLPLREDLRRLYAGRRHVLLVARGSSDNAAVYGRYLLGAPHVDSGFLTLLAQDGVEGLQARTRDGAWITVPPEEGTLAVNYGKVLERWTGGRIRATEHRVVGAGRERLSIPFFYEPDPDFEIAPLAGLDAEPFEPFLYGDHLWAATTRFVEQQGIAHLREPRGRRVS